MKITFAAYNNILFKSFRPWMDTQRNEDKYKHLLNAQVRANKDYPEKYFTSLVKAFIDLRIPTEQENIQEFNELSNLKIDNEFLKDIRHTTLPRFFNKTTEFFNYLIINTNISTISALLSIIKESINSEVAKLNVHRTLTSIENLLSNIPKVEKDSQPSKYVFGILKISLISLYCEIKLFFPEYLNDSVLDDYELIYKVFPDYESNSKESNSFESHLLTYLSESAIRKVISFNQKEQETSAKSVLSFGYNSNTNEKLKDLCSALTFKVDLLNETMTTVDDMLEILTSKDLSQTTKEIHINCETTQFRYIVDKFQPLFKDLSLANIEKSGKFFSKKGAQIKASNLSRVKIDAPKEKETIDRIFKEMQ